jgi:putative tricarboxylic transport membrane protein
MSDPDQGAGVPAADDGGPVLGSRWPELLLALALMAVAIVVIVDARRVGTGWDEFDGPRAGYFPFRIGCLLLLASGWIALKQLLSWRRADPTFASRTQLGSVWAITWPMGLYVALVAPLGIYLASFLLIAYFMRRHGRYRLPALLAVALGVPLFFFFLFERWFLVALPKGPIEAWLGF